MADILQHLEPSSIALTLDANKIAYGAYLSTFPGAIFHDEPGIRWFETGVPLDLFNGVLQIRLDAATIPAAIERVLAHFQQRGLPFQWHLGPSSQPQDAGDLLQARGIAHVEDEPGMALALDALNEGLPVSPDVTIHPVTTDDELRQWSEVWGCGAPEVVTRQWEAFYSALRFGPQEQMRFYLGLVNGEPVATSALFLGAGVASVEHVVTLPQARRQGIGAAMTLHAAREARKAGYRVAMLFASPMGRPIYQRLGFREYGTFRTFEWQPTSSHAE
jgi:GNAT superfamily N-acetyltransferase